MINKKKRTYRFALTVLVFYLLTCFLSLNYNVSAGVPSGNLSDYIRDQQKRIDESFGENFEEEEKEQPTEPEKSEEPDFLEEFRKPIKTGNYSVEELLRNQINASGVNKLWDKMPNTTRDIIESLGLTEVNESSFAELTPEKMIDQLVKIVGENSGNPFKVFGALIGIIMIFAFMSAMKETANNSSVTKVFEVVCSLTACIVLIIPVSSSIERVSAAAESTSVFMISFVPIYAGIMISAGQPTMAISYQSVVLFATELIALAATYFIVPFMTISLSLGLVGSMSPEYKINKIGETINKICSWLLGFACTLFVGLLSLQGIVANSADSISNRAIRFSLGSFMPIVGGALSEAFLSVQGCLGLLKSTVGGVGILVNILIVLPPIIECIMWLVTLSLVKSIAEMFELNGLVSIFSVVLSVTKTLVAILACCSLFMVIATTIVTKATSGI